MASPILGTWQSVFTLLSTCLNLGMIRWVPPSPCAKKTRLAAPRRRFHRFLLHVYLLFSCNERHLRRAHDFGRRKRARQPTCIRRVHKGKANRRGWSWSLTESQQHIFWNTEVEFIIRHAYLRSLLSINTFKDEISNLSSHNKLIFFKCKREKEREREREGERERELVVFTKPI